MYTFQARRLSKSFRDRTAVDGVSLSAEPGEVLGLVGPNGAGKTTLMLMLIGLLPRRGLALWEVHHQRIKSNRHLLGRLGPPRAGILLGNER